MKLCLRNACCHSVYNILISLLSKINLYEKLNILHGCGTWPLALKEERRLKGFENGTLRRIVGPKGDRVAGDWRKLHDEELHNLYSFQNIKMIKSKMR